MKKDMLKVVKVPKYRPERGLLNLLDGVKISVKNGDINGLFVVATNINGAISSGWHLDKGSSTFSMLGGIENTKQRFLETEIE